MKNMFTCCDCGETYPEGLDVERDFYLGHPEAGGNRCVFCYNNKTKHPLSVEQRYEYAYNLEHYGVAILVKTNRYKKE